AMSDWRLLLWGNSFQHILFLQLQKNAREQFTRWNPCKNSPPGLTRAIVLSPRDFERCHHTSLLAQSQRWRRSELFHSNGTLMQDLRQHAGVTGREEIRPIIGPCRSQKSIRLITIKCVRIWLWPFGCDARASREYPQSS